MNQLLGFLNENRAAMLRDLEAFVNRETPSLDKGLLDQFAAFLSHHASTLTGGTARIVPSEHSGDHVVLNVPGTVAAKPVLLVGHYDTVWPAGTLERMPFSVEDGVARGPGIFDMKGGLVQGLWALRALKALQVDHPPVTFIMNSDEEMGSPESQDLIRGEARQCQAAFVLEPSFDGALKTARKGVGHYVIHVEGRAAHAGLDPRAGISAIDELARIVLALHGQTDFSRGTTVNVGAVEGGTRYNVVAAQAQADVDVRFVDDAERTRLDTLIRDLRPRNPQARIRVDGGTLWPALQMTPASKALFDRARRISGELGIADLKHVSVGGASDGNTCGSAGVPVLDGLGAVGGGAHAVTEHLLVEPMPVRAALVANLLSSCVDAS